MIISRSPQNPTRVIGEYKSNSASDVAEKVAKARSAFRNWSQDPTLRGNALRNCASALRTNEQRLLAMMVEEVGKPLAESRGELLRAISIFDFYASATLSSNGNLMPVSGSDLLISKRHPYGVAGLITPWNFPIAIPVWKSAPALAVGNCVVIKPSEYATATCNLLAEIINSALPDGVFMVVPGMAETGAALIETADVISFTGSAFVGEKVVAHASSLGKTVQAEMGGHNPAIVLPDVDLNTFADQLVIGAFSYSGQKCTATRRVILVGDSSRKEQFLAAMESRLNKLSIGDPSLVNSFIGPLISESAQSKFNSATAQINSDGGKILQGRISLPKEGFYVQPTISLDLPAKSTLLQEEVFGPMTHLRLVEDIEEAVITANNVRYGLTASIHTNKLNQALSIADRLETGMVKINAPTAGVDFHAPFGGLKKSSYGAREQGTAALDFYSFTRTISIVGPKLAF